MSGPGAAIRDRRTAKRITILDGDAAGRELLGQVSLSFEEKTLGHSRRVKRGFLTAVSSDVEGLSEGDTVELESGEVWRVDSVRHDGTGVSVVEFGLKPEVGSSNRWKKKT